MSLFVFRSLLDLLFFFFFTPSCQHFIHIRLALLMLSFLFFFLLLFANFPFLPTPPLAASLVLCFAHVPHFSPVSLSLSLVKCVYTKEKKKQKGKKCTAASDRSCYGAKINITVVSHFILQTLMDGFCSPYTFHMLAFHFLLSPNPSSLLFFFHTQWRPFLPGLKYEVIDSAYISLYTGKSYFIMLILNTFIHTYIHLILESNESQNSWVL